MLFKRINVLLFVIGGLLLLINFEMAFGTMESKFCMVMFFVGLVLIAINVLTVIMTKKKNKALPYKPTDVMATKCIHCDQKAKAQLSQFKIHRRFPEGFVYCHLCKRPLSFTLFIEDPQNEEIAEKIKSVQ